MSLKIVTVPCLSDNYAYLVHDAAAGLTAVIDVPDDMRIETALMARAWKLTHILITHHHPDHIDGVDALRDATGAKVMGAKADAHRLPWLDCGLAEGERVGFGGVEIAVIEVPGHTIGHIAFHIPAAKAVFTADSLMALGCGRLFEGTAEQMWHSLRKLAELPPDTQVYSGHEYTEANARFALTIEPQNSALISRVDKITKIRAAGQATVPASLAEELATNPFLRAHLPEVKAAVGMKDASDAEVFAEIRRRKDAF